MSERTLKLKIPRRTFPASQTGGGCQQFEEALGRRGFADRGGGQQQLGQVLRNPPGAKIEVPDLVEILRFKSWSRMSCMRLVGLLLPNRDEPAQFALQNPIKNY